MPNVCSVDFLLGVFYGLQGLVHDFFSSKLGIEPWLAYSSRITPADLSAGRYVQMDTRNWPETQPGTPVSSLSKCYLETKFIQSKFHSSDTHTY